MLESGKRVLHQMSELVQQPVESFVALDRIFLSGNNNAYSEDFSLVTYYLAVVATSGSSTALVCFHMAAINEDPFQIGVCSQHVEELFPDAFFRPAIEHLVDGIPFAEMPWQISPRSSGPHSEQNTFDCSAQTCFVIQTELKQHFSQLGPQLLYKHVSGHCGLV